MKAIKGLSIFLLVIFTQNCSKDPYNPGCGTKQTYYYTLTSSALKQTPYFTNPAFDTISFASDKGDTLTFVKTKTDTTWYYEKGNGDTDCGYDKNYYQTIHNTYNTIKGVGNFHVKHNKKTNKSLSNVIEIRLNDYYFIFGDIEIGNKFYISYLNSFSINNRTYLDCLYEYNNQNRLINIKAYVNKSNGLFFINDSSNLYNYYSLN
jgi:hypothetical protein